MICWAEIFFSWAELFYSYFSSSEIEGELFWAGSAGDEGFLVLQMDYIFIEFTEKLKKNYYKQSNLFFEYFI